ncbi:membrane hypothetical protein [Vibrio nigripulchritudo SOn1]|uniref:Uncharacterized protein n=2 Tax=Vibrio nigripulchritudo TaxID=28173 RepID=A0AAV2VQJ4_9VIBR|nr:membrane hypothetical protein [Vibrio nigripulchritudo SOn1]
MVALTLLYTSLVRRFFYALPIAFTKLLGVLVPTQGTNGLTRIAVCMGILVVGFGQVFFNHASTLYLMYLNHLGKLWSEGIDHIASLDSLTMSYFEFGGMAIIFGIRTPSQHVAAGLVLFALSVLLAKLIDYKLQSK